jgi:hypothetical protein
MLIALFLIGLAFLAVPIANGAAKEMVVTPQNDLTPGESLELWPLSLPASRPTAIGDKSEALLPLAQQTTYTVPIVIDNTGNTSVLTDYQVSVVIDTTTPISDGQMRSDCGDIRFYDSGQGASLNYWLEVGCNSSTTQIWIKIPSIPTSSLKIVYMAYGDSNLTSASNGDGVFEFFDDFMGADGSTLDSSKWITDAVNTVTASIQGNKYRITDGTKSGDSYWIYNDTDSGSQDQAVYTLPTHFIVDWMSTAEDTSAN